MRGAWLPPQKLHLRKLDVGSCIRPLILPGFRSSCKNTLAIASASKLLIRTSCESPVMRTSSRKAFLVQRHPQITPAFE